MKYPALIARYPIISEQISRSDLSTVLAELEQTLEQDVPGDVAEFGCYVGTTSLFIRRLLDVMPQARNKLFYAYDSFVGLPEKTVQDYSSAGIEFKSGELRTAKKQLLHTFHKANLKPPIVHKAWFKDLKPGQLPTNLAFAFLDGDFYESIIDSLRLTWPRLSSRGVVVIDDYQRAALPGVSKAVQEFTATKTVHLHKVGNIAIMRKS